MFGTPTPVADLVVEVVNHTAWWQPYVPPLVGLVGSLIVAAAAFAGVVKSNNTNRAAIASADTRERDRWKVDSDREREKWHRDNLLRLSSEALRVAREIQQHYTDAASACTTTTDLAKAQRVFGLHMDSARTAINKVVPLSYDIELLGEPKVAFEFLEFREAAVFVSPAIEQFHHYLVSNFDRLRETAAATLTEDELHESLEWRRYYKATVHISTAIRDFQFAAQRKISPDSVPKDEPEKREPLITPEKDPDLFYGGASRRNSVYMRRSPFDWNAGDTADPPTSPAVQKD